MDIQEIITQFNSETDEKKVNTYIALFKEKYKLFFDNIGLVSSERKLALAFNLLTSKEAIARYVEENFFTNLEKLTKCTDQKVRKNTYSAMKNLKVNKKVFYNLIKLEDSYINIVHILSILESYDDVSVEYLDGVVENIDKENPNYSKAITILDRIKLASRKTVNLLKIGSGDRLLLVTSKAGIAILENDLKDNNIMYSKNDILSNGILVDGRYYEKILTIRSYYEFLIIPSSIDENYIAENQIIDKVRLLLNLDYWNKILGETRSRFSYRIEIRGNIDAKFRNEFAEKIVRKINSTNFVNIRDNYDAEIRVYLDGNHSIVGLRVPYIDDRFSYRKHELPASINPVNASIIAGIAKRYIHGDVKVLDGFVGTGTMLYELWKRNVVGEYVGVDIERKAIEFAKENIQDIPNVKLIRSNILDYNTNDKFDVIISNLPFGTRVLRHDQIASLYERFLGRFDNILSETGIAVLLTTDGKAIRKAVSCHNLRIRKEYRIESGGLIPYLFIIDNKND